MHLPWRAVALDGGPAIQTSVTLAETVRLRELAEGAEVLEIGAAYGYSTVVLAQVAKHVTSVDPHLVHGSYGILHANLGVYGLADRVEVLRQFSADALPDLIAAGRRFDLVFIDGDHTTTGVVYDIGCALQLTRPGGVIAVHDVTETSCCPEVGPAVDRLLPGYDLTDTMAVYSA